MFKYIHEDSNCITVYDEYFKYIDSVKSDLSDELYEFSSNVNRYDLSSPESLHDSWLRSLQVQDTIQEDGGINKAITAIEIELLGPHHDRVFCLKYTEVKSYIFDKPIKNIPVNHYDLLCHEVRVNGKGYKEHVILFDNEISFQIEFCGFSFSERLC